MSNVEVAPYYPLPLFPPKKSIDNSFNIEILSCQLPTHALASSKCIPGRHNQINFKKCSMYLSNSKTEK